VEEISLSHKILPSRYQRNRQMLSVRQQLALCTSRVAVFGCGGLGGYIIEELARLGVGNIIAVDPDVFEEHNLNRQIFSTPDLLGEKKVVAAARRVAEINPAVTLHQVSEAFSRENGSAILQDVHVAADALDSVHVRLALAEKCNQQRIPLVHGAIAGWFGHLAVQFPGETTLAQIYAGKKGQQGIEAGLGNPSFTPAVVASMEVAEIVKILLQTGDSLRNQYLAIDLYHMEVTTLPLDEM
jgi:molybdopterin/thiamine biosynthesis adenylyltransferase